MDSWSIYHYVTHTISLVNFQFSKPPQGDLQEDLFCRDFSCCGLELIDLHELLQHFEEYHVDVRVDSDDDEDLFAFDSMEDTDVSDMDSPLTFTDIYFKQSPGSSISLSDIYTDPKNRKKSEKKKQQMDMMEIDDMMEIEEMIPMNPGIMLDSNEEKDDRPYKCKVFACTKAYKNPGGLKYHMQHGHCEDTGDPEMNNIIHKPYQCTIPECGRRYKNLNGLKYHIEHSHLTLLNTGS